MVDHPHLSAGNTQSPSRELSAGYGVSPPSEAPSDNDMHSSSDARMLGCGDPYNHKSSSSSENSFNMALGPDINPVQISEIFRAAQQISHNDRIGAAEARKQNTGLIAFIEAMGHSMEQVFEFLNPGSQVCVHDDNTRTVRSLEGVTIPHSCLPAQVPEALIPTPGDGVMPAPESRRPENLKGKDIMQSAAIGPGTSQMMGQVGASTGDNREAGAEEDFVQKSNQTTPTDCNRPDISKQVHTWASVVSQGTMPKISLSFHPPILSDGAVTIKPPAEVLRQGNAVWSTCLVGSFINSRLPFKLVEETATKLWSQYGLLKVLLHDKDFFLFKFSSADECNNVMALGPWYMANKLLKLQLWKEGVDFSMDDSSKAPIWVKFHHIPLSYWTSDGLSYLASGIGKPLFVDKQTERLEPMNYARICIDILATSSFPESIYVTVIDEVENKEKTVEVKVEYQNIPHSCPTCKVFGHRHSKCPKANFKWVPKVQETQDCNIMAPLPAEPTKDIQSELIPANTQGEMQITAGPSWTMVTKGPKATPPASKTPVESLIKGSKLCINSFAPIASSDCLSLSDEDPPTPNPLVSKLLRVDEKEGKDQKNKARGAPESVQNSQKRCKGGGSSKPCLN